MAMASTSGRSSRSTLTHTNHLFINSATAGSSNDSRSITWHQWHAEYPMDTNNGRPDSRASRSASGPHGRQSTGLSLCCNK